MNRRKTIIGKGIVWIVALMLCVSMVFALGVRPVKTNLDFQEHYEGKFKIVNNDHKDMKVKLYVEGDLENYITLSQTEIEFKSSEEMKTIQFTMNLVEEELMPGKLEGRIIMEEQLYTKSTAKGYVAANLKLTHKVFVNLPYPEKYIEAKIDVKETDNEVDLITTVKNLGSTDLDEVKPRVDVFSGNEKIASYDNPSEQLTVNEEHSFRNYVRKEKLGIGEFKVLSTVNYAEYTLELIEAFTVGNPLINIVRYDKYFVQEKINELIVEIKSEWNTLIEGIYLEVFAFKDSKQIFSSKTTSFDLGPYEQRKVTSYFDTRGLELGDYDMNLVLHYGNETVVERYEASILDEKAYLSKSGRSPITYLLATVIVLLILVVILLAYFALGTNKRFKYSLSNKRNIKR
jgi:hypothetical protein